MFYKDIIKHQKIKKGDQIDLPLGNNKPVNTN